MLATPLRRLSAEAVRSHTAKADGVLQKVPRHKRPPRSGLQVLFEGKCAQRVIEVNADDQTPWRVLRRVERAASVVRREPRIEIRGDPDVLSCRFRDAPNDV